MLMYSYKRINLLYQTYKIMLNYKNYYYQIKKIVNKDYLWIITKNIQADLYHYKILNRNKIIIILQYKHQMMIIELN